MSKVAITEQYLTDIADAIRTKTGLSNSYFPSEMADAILTISGSGGITPAGTISITENGTYNVTSYASADVNVPTGSTINNQNKSVTPTESQQSITADSGYTGLGTVTVGGISSTYVGSEITRRTSDDLAGSLKTSTYDITVPAGYYASDGTFSITRRSASNLVTSVESGYLKLTYDNGYYPGGGKNLVEAKSSTNLTVSGATVTVPAGYYEEAASKSVSSMTLPTSASASATSGYTSKATISRSTSDQYINIPIGYNSAGGYYKINAVSNGSASAPTSISGTSATVSAGTNTLTFTKTVSVTPVVSAGYVSSGTATNSSVSLTASVTTKAAATITPGTTNQTIASGTYLTGTQTIAGDEDLVASNIVNGIQIFGVTGNVVLQNYYTGSSAPSSSIGSNGDIYLDTSGSTPSSGGEPIPIQIKFANSTAASYLKVTFIDFSKKVVTETGSSSINTSSFTSGYALAYGTYDYGWVAVRTTGSYSYAVSYDAVNSTGVSVETNGTVYAVYKVQKNAQLILTTVDMS